MWQYICWKTSFHSIVGCNKLKIILSSSLGRINYFLNELGNVQSFSNQNYIKQFTRVSLMLIAWRTHIVLVQLNVMSCHYFRQTLFSLCLVQLKTALFKSWVNKPWVLPDFRLRIFSVALFLMAQLPCSQPGKLSELIVCLPIS